MLLVVVDINACLYDTLKDVSICNSCSWQFSSIICCNCTGESALSPIGQGLLPLLLPSHSLRELRLVSTSSIPPDSILVSPSETPPRLDDSDAERE